MANAPGPTDIMVAYSRDLRCYTVLDIRSDGLPQLLATRDTREAAEAAACRMAEWLGLTFWTAPVIPLRRQTDESREVAW